MNLESGLNKKIEVTVEKLEELNTDFSSENIIMMEKFLEKFSLYIESEKNEMGEVKLSILKENSYLGEGGAGCVFSLSDDVCFKYMDNRKDHNGDINNETKRKYDNEAEIAKRLNGLKTENVRMPYFFGYYRTESAREILMEKINGVNLEYVLSGKDFVPENFFKRYHNEDEGFDESKFDDDLTDFIQNIHKKGVVHNDLEARNIMIDNDGGLVVIDTGLSIFKRDLSDIDFDKKRIFDLDKVTEISEKMSIYFDENKEVKVDPKIKIKDFLNKAEKVEEIEVKIFDEIIMNLAKEKINENPEGLSHVKEGIYVSKNRDDLILGLSSVTHEENVYYIGFKK